VVLVTTAPPERPWPARLTDTIGAEIKRLRQEKKWTTEELAARVTNAGLRYTRDQVVNLERTPGRRNNITRGEVTIFAAVLGVPPAFLVAPVGSPGPIEYLPGRTTDPWHAYLWFTGQGADTLLGDDRERFPEENRDVAIALDAFRRHHDAVIKLDMSVRHAESGDPAAERMVDAYTDVVVAVRNEIRSRGWTPPLLPPEVEDQVEQAEKAAR
jgi:transcriptional regulator with XRE-family HTH domain